MKPTDFTEELAAQLCARMAEGNSLRKVCEADDMPTKSLVFKWLANNEQFRDQYARAQEALLNAHAEDIIEIADDIPPNAPPSDVNKARLRIDSRKWIMSKLSPKRYGEKVTQEHSGPDGKAIPLSLEVHFVEPQG